MKVLVVGGGGREHAICWKLAQSPKVTKLYCAPGNGGIAQVAQCVPIKATDVDGMVKWAKENAMDFVVVAPDDPLALGMVDQLDLIESVERLAPQVFQEVRGIDKPICANVDLYSGFVYRLLGIPTDLYTAIFASARMAGWCAHRMEECCSDDPRIIRPAYKTICKRTPYVPLAER